MPGQAPYQGLMSDIVGSGSRSLRAGRRQATQPRSGPDVSLQESPSGRAYKVFDPESDGYFERIGDHLNAERPLEDATKPPILVRHNRRMPIKPGFGMMMSRTI